LIDFSLIEKSDDLELVNLAKQGNQMAFTEIVKRHKSRIAATIYGMIGKCDEADDIGQEVFIRFYNSIDKFRGESALSTYLTRIAINLSLNEIKRRRRRRFLTFDKLAEEGIEISDPSQDIRTSGDDREIIQMAINKLNMKYRSVLVLRLIDGYTSEETAKILNVPLGTVLSRLARAQTKLQEYLKPYISEL
jgi:RNA polymerase sigma-70 factor, ECF subfamily